MAVVHQEVAEASRVRITKPTCYILKDSFVEKKMCFNNL